MPSLSCRRCKLINQNKVSEMMTEELSYRLSLSLSLFFVQHKFSASFVETQMAQNSFSISSFTQCSTVAF